MKKALVMALALLFTASVSGLAFADGTTNPPKKSHKKHHSKKKGHASSMPTPSAK
ncbi:MAG TPA: hypothetical protein VJ873_01385 [bacterium]|nr:hypothetical protein [bacterium]